MRPWQNTPDHLFLLWLFLLWQLNLSLRPKQRKSHHNIYEVCLKARGTMARKFPGKPGKLGSSPALAHLRVTCLRADTCCSSNLWNSWLQGRLHRNFYTEWLQTHVLSGCHQKTRQYIVKTKSRLVQGLERGKSLHSCIQTLISREGPFLLSTPETWSFCRVGAHSSYGCATVISFQDISDGSFVQWLRTLACFLQYCLSCLGKSS